MPNLIGTKSAFVIIVALLAALLSAIGNRLGSILQMIFGWSISALFGQLPRKKQIAVSAALLLSLAWPVLLLGLIVPSVASWALALLPLEKWLGETPLRVIWAVLAVIAPLVVGGLVRWAAPAAKVGTLAALLYGYPLVVAFFVSFVITAITVPLVKLGSLARGWSDEHVYLQPRPDAYAGVIRDLSEATARAGLKPVVMDVPRRMTLATQVIKTIGRSVAEPMIGAELRRVCADGIELYVYPADLLLRGKPERIAAVRGMMTLTGIETNAYLVGSDEGQVIQDEIGHLSQTVTAHEERRQHIGNMAGARLGEIWDKMNSSKLPFHEWTILETLVRRLERRLAREKVGSQAFAIDRRDDGLTEHQVSRKEALCAATTAAAAPTIRTEESTGALVREALSEASALVRTEMTLATAELRKDLHDVTSGAVGMAIGLVTGIVFLACVAFAAILALGATPLIALAVAGVFLIVGVVASFVGYKRLPLNPLNRTRKRLQSDLSELKEHVA